MRPVLLLPLLGGLLLAQPGAQADGSTLLANGWRIKPAGTSVATDPLPSASVLSKDGKFLLVLHSGAAPALTIFDAASMRQLSRVPLVDAGLGLAFSPDQRFLYVGGGARNSVLEFSWANGDLKATREMGATAGSALAPSDFIGDVAASPDGRLLYAADVFHDSIVVINPQSGRVIERFKTGRRPYRILFHPDGKSYFVTSWTEGTLYQHETANGAELSRLRLGPQTTDMAISDRKPADDESGARYRIFVTASGTNNVFAVGVDANKELKTLEVINVGLVPAQPAGMTPSALALSPDQARLHVVCSDANTVAVIDTSEVRSRIAGFIPVGEYPTAARALPDGRLAVMSAPGSISAIPAPDDAALATYTSSALSLTSYRAEMAEAEATAKSVIEHVVYILTDRPVAGPNQAKLSREFVSFNNYFVHGASLAENHLWAAGSIAPAFTRRMLPSRIAGRLRFANFAGGEPANLPPAGYVWSNARLAGLTVRNYGEFVENDRPTDGSLIGITNLNFKGPDADRVRIFLEDWQKVEASGAPPRLSMVRLAGDDAALGTLIEAISKSKSWGKTAVFVAGTTGSEGLRSSLLVLSPYTRRGAADNAFYNQASVLRTVELILGLRPMTQFDAAARPLTAAFAPAANNTPYQAAAP